MPDEARPIRTLLVANRGEIARRIFRTAREMGIATVAVASEPDAQAPHALEADRLVVIGEGPPSASYLDIGKILAAAKETRADAVHPGYGFLSERAEFAAAVTDAGLIFVGPPAAAMRALGDKIAAKTLAQVAGVPTVPGFFAEEADDETILAAAREMGMPVMLKASAGGGGRGMRVVRDEADLQGELTRARDEAKKAFGDDAMMVERLVERPRHIEIQAIADAHGNVACLYERECSLQRRHQKLIEEAPSPFVDEAMYAAMRDASVALLRAAGYVGAATIEFIVDPASRAFYFLEVNARLQVEHPVTEAITGLDLVRLQIEVAEGRPLRLPPLTRERVSGWAIEARVIAEDPARGFLPSVGRIERFDFPTRPGLRVDAGYTAGGEVTPFYDSLLAKLVAHGPDREAARRRLVAALRETHILGVRTNVAFLIALLEDEAFVTGEMSTGTVAERFGDWTPAPPPPELAALAAALSTASTPRTASWANADARTTTGAWDLADGFRNARAA